MVRAAVLLGVWSAFCGSQAFFLTPAPTAARRSSSTASGGAAGLRDRRRGSGGVAVSARRNSGGAGGGTVKKKKVVKNRLEEVSDELASKPVALECPRTGDTLVCFAERVAVVGGKRYLVAFPKDPAVAIAFEEKGEVSPVPNDDPIMGELFPLAEACVADLGPGVKLLRTPTTLTVEGLNELVEAKDKEGEGDDEMADLLKIDDDEVEEKEEEEEEEEEDEDEEADEVELLGEFLLEGEEFLIVRFLEPILVLAKEKAPGKYVLIDEEEEQDTIPVVDDLLCGDASI